MTEAEPWVVEYEPRAIKDLRRLDRPVRERLLDGIDRVARRDPSADVRRIAGTDRFRLRVGNWRVIFELDEGRLVVVVIRALPRGRAYDR